MKVNIKLVGDLMSEIKRRQQMTPRFRIPFEPQAVLDMLTQFYLLEVAKRQGKCELDEFTQKNLIAVTEAITSPTPKLGVWLYGEPGNGKTTMMYSFMRLVEYLANGGHFKFMGEYFNPRPRFRTAKEIVALSQERPRDFEDLLDISILCIDDVATEPKEYLEFGNVKTPMMDLFMHRYRFQGYTFITSNLSPSEIRDKYDERVADRCREMFEPIKFLAPTYRKR